MRKITCIIVDDNEASIALLKGHASGIERLLVEATFTDPLEALKYLRTNHVDVVLLDIQMEPINGLQFMAQMPQEMKVVLCSGHKEYAFEGFENNAVDFIDKTVDFKRFSIAINKVEFALGLSNSPLLEGSGDYYYFLVRGILIKNRRLRVEFDDIVYLETKRNMTLIHLHNSHQPLETKQRLKKIMELLPPANFKRIHKSFVINQDYLGEYADGEVRMNPFDVYLPVGKKKSNMEFFVWMEKHTLR